MHFQFPVGHIKFLLYSAIVCSVEGDVFYYVGPVEVGGRGCGWVLLFLLLYFLHLPIPSMRNCENASVSIGVLFNKRRITEF